jgi:hypothetical protein
VLKENTGDDFVEFRCTKLLGFAQAALAARSKPENSDLTLDDIKNLLCTDEAFAKANGFYSDQYMKTIDNKEAGNEFDFDSISK